jgi:hypothetical protein
VGFVVLCSAEIIGGDAEQQLVNSSHGLILFTELILRRIEIKRAEGLAEKFFVFLATEARSGP